MKKNTEIESRQLFIDAYTNFDKWLLSIGFRNGHYWEEASTESDYNYSYYDEHINSFYGVECYVQDTLELTIRFIRDRYEHKIMFIKNTPTTYSLDEAKEYILADFRKIRDEKTAKLSVIAEI